MISSELHHTGLSEQETNAIIAVFSRYPQVKNVLLYGSRAKGNFRPDSDIDLSLVGNDIDLSLQNEIELELDDLMLPYKFDISVYRKIKDAGLINHIDRVGKLIYHEDG